MIHPEQLLQVIMAQSMRITQGGDFVKMPRGVETNKFPVSRKNMNERSVFSKQQKANIHRSFVVDGLAVAQTQFVAW